MSIIVGVEAREILDSRGNPTVEVDVELDSGARGRAAVPSGASTGSREALELRDKDKDRFLGKGVLKAVHNVQERIAPEIMGMDALRQLDVDSLLLEIDGTDNKTELGANAMLGVSMAVARAAAEELEIPLYQVIGGMGARTLPVPQMNVINGGVHAPNNLDIQEFMIFPAGADSFAHALRMGAETFHALKNILAKDGHITSVGDEGGFAPNLKSHEQAFQYLVAAIQEAGYEPGRNIWLGIDAAASEFYSNGEYVLSGEGRRLSSAALIEYYQSFCSQFPIMSIEDGLAEGDWEGWQELTMAMPETQLVGDDVFVTNPNILSKGIEDGVANSILIKLNQIGTLTETLTTIEMAKNSAYTNVVSHRSGETEDSFIADLVVAVNGGQIKSGSLSRSDRLAKYNQLLRIEEDLAECAEYFGPKLIRRWG